MLRPWWFPEFSPQEQKTFDTVLAVLTQVFQQYNYEHIRTPAVEPVEILKRGGDIVDKQVYGLYGLAQWPEDTKDYALHFDLTIPLARYILDHRQELTFPFKRFQMQPVRRGERTKRWRYKEFRQFDVDVVWPSEAPIGTWYDTETVAVLDKAMQKVTETFDLDITRVLKISHIWLTKSRLTTIWISDQQVLDQVLNLLDAYFKLERKVFEQQLDVLVTKEIKQQIIELIETKNTHMLVGCEGYDDLMDIFAWLSTLGVSYEYDVCIVRGHSYYRWMVCEWFQTDDIALWSLAAWGRYDHVTDFIDPKQSFSGVGTSLGRFIYLAIEKIGVLSKGESYLFVNFEDTYQERLRLYTKFIAEGKTVEWYPTAAKFWKQLDYANKKGITHAVVLWGDESKNNTYIIKDLETGKQYTHPL